MMNGIVTTVRAPVAENPCQEAVAPNLVGMSIKTVNRQMTRLNGKDVTTITLTMNDGTKVMALAHTPGNYKNVSNPGLLLIVDKQGCKFFTE